MYSRATEFMEPKPIQEEPLLVQILGYPPTFTAYWSFYPNNDTVLQYHKNDKKLDKYDSTGVSFLNPIYCF